jgi:hypothetical protein
MISGNGEREISEKFPDKIFREVTKLPIEVRIMMEDILPIWCTGQNDGTLEDVLPA